MSWYAWFSLLWIPLFIVPIVYVSNKGKTRGHDVIVRCSVGHLYTTIWIPAMSLKAVRWVNKRYQRCPVGKHWAWTERVNKSDLNPEIAAEAGKFRDLRIP